MEPPPQPPLEAGDLPGVAVAVMRRAKFPVLATVDAEGQPRVRPISPVRTEGFTVYVANLRRYGKTAELAANPRAELCYLDDRHDQVRITARAEVVSDKQIIDSIWHDSPLLRRYLGSPDNPDLIIYRFVPQRVRFMREWALDYLEVPGGCIT